MPTGLIIALAVLQTVGQLTPAIIAILQAIQAQGGTPTPAQSAQLQAYTNAHSFFSQGAQTLISSEMQ